MAKQTSVVSTAADRWHRPPTVTSGFYTTAPSSSRTVEPNSTEHVSQHTYPPHQVSKRRSKYNHRDNPTMSPPGVSDGGDGPNYSAGRMGSAGDSSGGTGNNSVGKFGGKRTEGRTLIEDNPPVQGNETGTTGVVGHHDLENLDSCSRSPLLCLICNTKYEDPRLLACYHSFCAKCLQGRIGETKLICPLCGKPTPLKDGLCPPVDRLLRFLLQATADTQPTCANCDNKTRVPMYYCNTCGQVLCNGCREETHRAKMFSAHDIIPVSKYAKETPKRCSVHGEQYIMFSTVQKSMLCINCYRDTPRDERLHCVDLDTAYSQGCRKLDRAVISLQDLQRAVRDGILMLKNVLEELRRNSDSEKSAVNAVCQTISDALTKTQENLLREVDCQCDMKDKVINGQLSQLRTVLPTIKLHLTMCATISNATSKYDFLDLAYPLIDRLTAITHMGYPIRPGQSSQIKSLYKAEIARTLEPWIAGAQHMSSVGGSLGGINMPYPPIISLSSSQIPKEYARPTFSSAYVDNSINEPTYSQYYPMSRSTVAPITDTKSRPGINSSAESAGGVYAAPVGVGMTPSAGRKTPTAGPAKSSKPDGVDDNFASHCRTFTSQFNELSHRLNRLKEQVQELHRDVTLHRGSSYIARTESALREGLLLEDHLSRRYAEMEQLRKAFEVQWNEHIKQIREKQDVFQSQMNDLLSLRSEVKQLSGLLQQLQTFLKSMGTTYPQRSQQRGSGPSDGPGGGDRGGNNPGGGGDGHMGGMAGSSAAGGSNGFQALHPAAQDATGTPSQSSRSHQAKQMGYDTKSYHVSPPLHPRSRAEASTQVTASMGDVPFATRGAAGMNACLKTKETGNCSTRSDHPQVVQGRFPAPIPVPPKTRLPTSSPGPHTDVATHDFSIVTSHASMSQTAPMFSRPPTGRPLQHAVISQPNPINPGMSRPQYSHQQDMEYVQIDTSYQPHASQHVGRLIPMMVPVGGIPSEAARKGVFSQLMDKVRSRDDRKKSTASGVSSSSSGGTIPQALSQQQAHAHPATSVMSGKASAYDSQCQYGTLTPIDASIPHSSMVRQDQNGHQRAIYTRAKSFVKSKSDDERPPSRLSKESRARSAGQLETDTLLRSLSTSSKDASKILSLYQGMIEREGFQMLKSQPKTSAFQPQHNQQHSQQPHILHQNYQHHLQQQQHQHALRQHHSSIQHPMYNFLVAKADADKASGEMPKLPMIPKQHLIAHQQAKVPVQMPQVVQGQSIGCQSNPSTLQKSKSDKCHGGNDHGHEFIEDDYQFLPMTKPLPVSRSQSAPPRKPPPPVPSMSGTQQVKVYVHGEPRSTRSSPSATLSRSLEESYLCGFLAAHQKQGGGGGGVTPSSSGGQSGDAPVYARERSQSAFTPFTKKSTSVESLVSLITEPEHNSTGHSRKSSIDFDRRSVVTVKRAGSKSTMLVRQNSWGTGTRALFPTAGSREQSISTPQLSPDDPFESGSGSSSRHSGGQPNIIRSGSSSRLMTRSSMFYDNEQGVEIGNALHKADSFEGHEEAVRSIVAAVQETRSLQRRFQSS